MRILHVSDCFRPRVGGIEVQVEGLAAAQHAAGHQVEVWTTTPAPAPSLERVLAVPVYRLPALAGIAPAPSGLARLAREIRSARWDVVHAHTSIVSPLAWAAARTAGAAGVPAVVTLHSLLRTGSLPLGLSQALGWTGWPVAFTAVSHTAAAPLRALGLEVAVLPNGIDVDWWHPTGTPRTIRPAPRPVTLVSVMRLARRKRPAELAAILRRIRELVPPAIPLRAVVVGDGPQRADLERRLRAGRLADWVELTGTLTRERIRDVLQQSDLYLAPARRESFGIAALEARCSGLPLIAMASGGVGEFVRPGVDGLLVTSDDEMARAAARLITGSELPAMRRRSLASSPASLAWPKIIGRSLQCYQDASARTDAAIALAPTSVDSLSNA